MKSTQFVPIAAALSLTALLTLAPTRVLAHCDTLDGPVVKAAQAALAKGNVKLVLPWVRPADEEEIKAAFERALSVRKLGAEAQELADRYFFETLVRVHRAGEGAPYTGLKPAGTDLGPAIPAADKALQGGDIGPLLSQLERRMAEGVRERFQAAAGKKRFEPGDVAAGREYVRAYVDYVHYVEGVHQALGGVGHGHAEGAEEAASAHTEAGSEPHPHPKTPAEQAHE